MERFATCSAELEDPREANAWHDLHEILLIVPCAMLCGLSLKGAIVTADALNCQRTIAAKVGEKGSDYVLASGHGVLMAACRYL
jgi:hypothetical protein